MINQVICGDCLSVMKDMPDNSVDSIVTDPPYGLSAAKNSGKTSKGGFMGKKWDYDVPSVEIWKEALRVLKPGGYALIACGTRTQHRMAVNIEDAGFEIRDMILYVYGSGFPKSLNVSKQLDKMAGAEREVVGKSVHSANRKHGGIFVGEDEGSRTITAPATPEAKQWEGFGTALKPAVECFSLARKPLSEKNVALNVLKWGTGVLNIDGCRVGYASEEDKSTALAGDAFKRKDTSDKKGWSRPWMENADRVAQINIDAKARAQTGRFPANLITDGSDEVVSLFPNSKGDPRTHKKQRKTFAFGNESQDGLETPNYNDSGSAARFFYSAKSSKRERNLGLEDFDKKENAGSYHFRADGSLDGKATQPKANDHSTVKPLKLMRYLCRLVTPPGGIVLDCFLGSGSTACAAVLEGFRYVGIEQDRHYCDISEARIKHWAKVAETERLSQGVLNLK
jgi:DNA modification methylase